MIKVDNNFVILIITIVFLAGIYIMTEYGKYSKYVYIFVISTIVLFTAYMWNLYIQEEYRLQNDPKLKELKEKV